MVRGGMIQIPSGPLRDWASPCLGGLFYEAVQGEGSIVEQGLPGRVADGLLPAPARTPRGAVSCRVVHGISRKAWMK